MPSLTPPEILPSMVGGRDVLGAAGEPLEKRAPHDGRVLWRIGAAGSEQVAHTVAVAREAQSAWAATDAPSRGNLLHSLAQLFVDHLDALTEIVSIETGKSPREARGELEGAITLGRFFAGEGLRLFGRTTTSHVATKYIATVREPVGVAALLGAANTPAANIAWKLFPALVCGNSVVVKAAETAPATAWAIGQLARQAGLPNGVVNILQGGRDVGRALVADRGIDVVSFTGSTGAGREIARVCAERIGRVSLELGGKNPMIICDDADVELAVKWATLSAFSNAGQRCASGSRLIVSDAVYDRFIEAFLSQTTQLRLGPTDEDDLGAVITEESLQRILDAVAHAALTGQELLAGGYRLDDSAHRDGFYVAPTIIVMNDMTHPLTDDELFGPVAQVYRARNYEHALRLANASQYGLTAAIHTRDYATSMHFVRHVSAGMAVVNGGTFGSEPHIPFGGRRMSGNGTREPGPEALDVYTNLKTVFLWGEPGLDSDAKSAGDDGVRE
jgi:acyl-CoA reductase-like NAD-dependent aldehyde dehydrogenase